MDFAERLDVSLGMKGSRSRLLGRCKQRPFKIRQRAGVIQRDRVWRRSGQRGFTITELIVVITLVILLAALAVTAYNKLVNDARVAKSAGLVTMLSTAKSMFVGDKNTTPAQIAAFNAAPESNFSVIAQYIRINGAIPKDMNDLLSLCGIPASGDIKVTIGTVDDGTGGTPGVVPTVTGYGISAASPTPG